MASDGRNWHQSRHRVSNNDYEATPKATTATMAMLNITKRRRVNGEPVTLHELTTSLALCESLTKHDRDFYLAAVLNEFVASSVIDMCSSRLSNVSMQTILQFLTFGTNVSVDSSVTKTLEYFSDNAIGGPDLHVHRADACFMLKNVDVWYEYASYESCAKICVDTELHDTLHCRNEMFTGKLCQRCVSYLTRWTKGAILPRRLTRQQPNRPRRRAPSNNSSSSSSSSSSGNNSRRYNISIHSNTRSRSSTDVFVVSASRDRQNRVRRR